MKSRFASIGGHSETHLLDGSNFELEPFSRKSKFLKL